MQKTILQLSCLVLVLIGLHPHTGRAAVVDRNVAIVNNDTITLSEVNELAKPYFDQVRAQVPADQQTEAMAQARRMVVERLIDKRLVAQEAAKRNLRVSDAELDSTLQQLLLSRNVTPDEFQQELQEIGLSEKQYREELRDQVLSSKVINAVVRSKVLISEDKILERYHSQTKSGTAQGMYNLLQIGIMWGTPDKGGKTLTKQQAKEKIEQIHRQLLAGSDFATLAKAHSNLPSADDGGILGNFRLQDMAAPIRAAVENLGIQDISPVVEQEPSFLIFKRITSPASSVSEQEQQTANVPSPAEREQIHQQLLQEEMEKRLDQWVQGLRSKAYIRIF